MMLFPEEHAGMLKDWIVGRIENTSDADSDVLAEYVIALLKHDGDQQTIRALCEQEIPDFLDEDPKAFLDDVFEAIQHQSYLPGQRPPQTQPPRTTPRQNAPPQNPPSQNVAQPTPPQQRAAPSTQQRSPETSPQDVATRKRGFDEVADGTSTRIQAPGSHQAARPNKQARRGGAHAPDHGRNAQMNLHLPPLPPPPPGMPAFNPNNPMETLMQLDSMGLHFPFPGFPPSMSFEARSPRNQPRKRGRCRDYDTKGYCDRGSTCMYDHGQESIYVPSTAPQSEEYDPNNAIMGMAMPPSQPPFPFAMGHDMNRGRGRKTRASQRGGRRGGARSNFSAEGPVLDGTKSTIVVENIPEESFGEEQVRSFFSQFGTITDINLQPYKHLAIVKYDSWAAANDAYRSPKVIFDNRFVKVFWYKEDADAQPSASGTPQMGANVADPSQDNMSVEEFRKRQEEAQKQHQEREAKKAELERQRQVLEQQQQELVAKQQAERDRLQAKLSNKSPGQRAGPSSGTDMLRAQLAALEQEAKQLGLDPNSMDDGTGYGQRGGFRGRALSHGRAWRGRGRGSFRGHEARHAAYAHYSIDNRPRKVALTGADFTPAAMDEKLRHFLLNLGDFDTVETTPAATHVTFPDRKTAEKFFYSLHDRQLPGVEAKLHVAWVNNGLLPAVKTAADTGADEAMDDAAHAAHQQDASMGPIRPVDMDYEAGDDEAWGDGIQ